MPSNIPLFRRSVLLGSSALLALSVGTSGAFAQDSAADEMEFEEVVVTGSRIVRKEFSSASPVAVTSSEEIALSGFNRIEDLMNTLPQFEAGQTSNVVNGSSGTATVDLRGLGVVRTLVLVNGRRLQSGGVFSSGVADINQIPAALVERVEVMTGGGSSTYGSDAIAGVVNYVMKDDFEGIEITGGISAYQHSNRNDYLRELMDARGFEYPTGTSIDGATYNMSITAGGTFADGRGNAIVYGTWQETSELLQGARDYSSCALSNAGTGCGGSANAIIPNFDVYPIDPITGASVYAYHTDSDGNNILDADGNVQGLDGDGNPFSLPWANPNTPANRFLSLDPTTGEVIDSPASNRYNFGPVNHYQRPNTRWTLGGMADYEINEHARAYIEGNYMSNRTTGQIAESGTFFAAEYAISCNNPILGDNAAGFCEPYGLSGDDQIAVYIGKRNVEGGKRRNTISSNSYRLVVGVDGEINDSWRYDVSFQYGATDSTSTYENDFFAPNIAPAIDGNTCTGDGCYQVFTLNGVTPESARNLTATAILTGYTDQSIISGYVTGDIGYAVPWAEDAIAAVFGVEYRDQNFDRVSDQLYEQGLLLGQGGAIRSVSGSISSKEVFGELMVPIVQGAEFAKDITLELGGRYSDYSTSGGNFTYKAQLSWTPVDMVTFNASYNRAVRAPNATELFLPQSQGLWAGTDSCAGPNPSLTQAQCVNTGLAPALYGAPNLASPAAQYNSITGGNPNLQPETATTYTLGAVIRPTNNIVVRVDLWDIKIEDVIGVVSPQLALDQCGQTGGALFCNLVNRAPNGSLWLGTQGNIVGTNINLANRHWQGVDVIADGSWDVGSGTLTAHFTGTYTSKKEYDPLPGNDTAKYDCAGIVSALCVEPTTGLTAAHPKWRHTMRVAYSPDSFWSVSANWRFTGGTTYNETVDTLVGDGLGAESYFDLTAAFEVTESTALLVGMNNVLDSEPPLVGGTLGSNANTIGGLYDILGRYMFANVTFKF